MIPDTTVAIVMWLCGYVALSFLFGQDGHSTNFQLPFSFDQVHFKGIELVPLLLLNKCVNGGFLKQFEVVVN